jgi:hypothetical protein
MGRRNGKRSRTSDGICMTCRASLNMANCDPPDSPCPDCGQCKCLDRTWMMEDPE